ncbi:RidA family protein [Pseudomaricurvus alkylphenolicus]|uniref:RidA family protein n=1 Tax=Pseudomaricurvus alkylphenolicus TaxID=1306991 RepID=UPI001422128B|nr:RidA family protein [Pseudomaricurvus alkylphenolicus]NIB40291.1 RidA family protein [Pseudomaricurvus alkylphenolicus]
MPRDTINPDSMYTSVPFGFSQATRSVGGTTIHCSGQVAWDKQCEVIGGSDLGAQARQVMQNLKAVLEEAGASSADVVRMRTYVVDYSPACLEPIGKAIAEFYGDELPPANTLLGVQSLAMPEFLIEVEVTAVID